MEPNKPTRRTFSGRWRGPTAVFLALTALVSACGGQSADLEAAGEPDLVQSADQVTSTQTKAVESSAANMVASKPVPPTISDPEKAAALVSIAPTTVPVVTEPQTTDSTAVPATQATSTTSPPATTATTVAPPATTATTVAPTTNPTPSNGANKFPDLQVTNVVTGDKFHLKSTLGGGNTPVLFWFWSPT